MALLKINQINGEKPQIGNPEHIAFCKEITAEFEVGIIRPHTMNQEYAVISDSQIQRTECFGEFYE